MRAAVRIASVIVIMCFACVGSLAQDPNALSIHERIPDAVLLDAVDLELPGLEAVKAAVAAGDAQAAGREFATATAGAAGDVASTRMATLLGRETVLRGLDALSAQLTALRQKVASGDAKGIDALLASASADRERWIKQSRSRSFGPEAQAIERDTLFGRTLRSMLGNGVTGRTDR